ncbi:hypothetical protein [Sporomusa ovata]|uniref:hypothetical protein n=1 Tax=Sporomusa ovata TaxID=2378 RepID=UPI0030D03B48
MSSHQNYVAAHHKPALSARVCLSGECTGHGSQSHAAVPHDCICNIRWFDQKKK